MAGLTDSAETNILSLLFQNATWAGVGDGTGLVGSGVAGSLYVSLHTADPGEAGDQTTNETVYTNYARVAVARSAGGWTVTGDTVSNAAAITFPECGATGATLTHFGIGKAAAAAGELILKGALNSSLNVSSGITPNFAIGQLTATAA